MKSLLMSLTLFIPATSALAESTDYQSLIELHHTHHDAFESQRFLSEPEYDEDAKFLKLIQIQDNNQQIKTIKANVSVSQQLIEAVT